MKARDQHPRAGFTLIELLVVIAIIGVLASIVTTALNSARVKARDASRRAELKSIQTALEFYYDTNGTYKVTGSGYNGGGQGWFGFENSGAYSTAVSRVLYNDGYLGAPLVDDIQQSPGYMIYICNNGQEYAVTATLEEPTAEDISNIQTSCNGTGGNGTYSRYGKNFAVTD